MSRVRSGRGSKQKGSNFERELAEYINSKTGLSSRRALLSGGGRADGGADLDGTPLMWVEAKRVENFSPLAALRQAEAGVRRTKSKLTPVVVNRRNGMKTGESLVVLRLDDFLQWYVALLGAVADRDDVVSVGQGVTG